MSVDHLEFLTRKYADLSGSKPVERAVAKKIREGEKGPTTQDGRVGMYLDRLQKFFEMKELRKGKGGIKLESGFEKLKGWILHQYTTRYEEIPESYWTAQEEEAWRRGEGGDWAQATPEQREEVMRKHAEIVLTDQRSSLEQWLDYFSLPDCTIPNYLKYWIFRNIIQLKELVKSEVKKPDGSTEQKIEFPKRSKGTVAPFPDLNQEALSYVMEAIKKKLAGKKIEFEHDIQPDEREEFARLLAKENFAQLYAWANELMSPIPERLLPITEGRWVKYDQGSDPEELVRTIRGKGTGWCTAGLSTAKTQLSGGDFYVYYSLDDNGKPTYPRIAIRMEGPNKIAEAPRGIAWGRDEINDKTKAYIGQLEPGILETLAELGVEQIYTSLSRGKIKMERNFEAGPITFAEFQRQTRLYNAKMTDELLKVRLGEYVWNMAQKIGSFEHPALKSKEIITLVRLGVCDLFQDEKIHTTREIFEKADELGLELCPPEVCLIKRLKDTNQPMGDWYCIAMKPIADSRGSPRVFDLHHDDYGLWLDDYNAKPDNKWNPDNNFVFCLRKQNSET